MNFVEPIRDVRKIAQIKNLLRWEGNIRDLLLFELGINSALRVSDLLLIRVSDVFAIDGTPADFFDVKEEKTSKSNRITITPKVKETLKLYAETYPEVITNRDYYIFFAKKKFPNGSEAIKRGMSWIILSKLCEAVGLKGNFWNHTLRKTWGYQARIQGIPLEIIQHKLNHSSLVVTQKYLGITADEIAEACNRLDL